MSPTDPRHYAANKPFEALVLRALNAVEGWAAEPASDHHNRTMGIDAVMPATDRPFGHDTIQIKTYQPSFADPHAPRRPPRFPAEWDNGEGFSWLRDHPPPDHYVFGWRVRDHVRYRRLPGRAFHTRYMAASQECTVAVGVLAHPPQNVTSGRPSTVDLIEFDDLARKLCIEVSPLRQWRIHATKRPHR